MDTIFALATAQGKAGVAVVRLSGPGAHAAGETLAGALPVHGRGLRAIRDDLGGLIDQALVLTFDQGRSFTGEPVVELHLHGSAAIVKEVLRVLGNLPGLRMAEAGEFTRRALENGRLDLAQVEGLADLIDAETEAQRKQAVRVLTGAMGAKADGWRQRLIRAAALIEATIDFADEDVPVDVTPEVVDLLVVVVRELQEQAQGAAIAERIRDGFEVAIVGAPNVGKSTLLNRLAGRDAALTSEYAGTTRDVIEVRMDLGGLPVTILDTAGVRETADVVEGMGIARALDRAAGADIRIFLVAGDEPLPMDRQADDLVLMSKSDLAGPDVRGISGMTGAGIDTLIGHLQTVLGGRAASVGVAVRERHRVAMARAADALMVAVTGLQQNQASDLVAEDIRTAIRAVDSLVGRIDVDDLLGEIFASFCIGK